MRYMILFLWATLTRGRPVYLKDRENQLYLTIARNDAWGDLRAEIYWPWNIRSVRLLKDGKCDADSYRKQWIDA